jgi:long-chain acyl-CoA synthetase
MPFDALRAHFTRAPDLPDVRLEADDDSTILYTSGTTGSAKGAVISHRNHCTNLLNGLVAAAASGPATGQKGLLMPLPMFHVSGLSLTMTALISGSKVVMPRKWDPDEAVALIERERLTQFVGVAAMANRFLAACESTHRDLTSLTSVTFGASVVPPDLVRLVDRVFGGRVATGTGYGMTETTSSISRISGRDYLDHPDSVGTPTAINEIRIVSQEDGDQPPGGVGELWVRGPNVVRGYWRQPEATAVAFVEGWHRTGDLATVIDGQIHLVGRVKDVVIRAGENIQCAEVEAVLGRHPAIEACAVVGVPHDELGEELVAVVHLKTGLEVEADELRDHVAAELAYFKVPSMITFVDRDLPRTATGKILKRTVVEEELTRRERGRATP